ncbi:MAG: hypothetical protein ACYTBS_10610 [Planctomycetota bacterium]|jgi:hypothetical protein
MSDIRRRLDRAEDKVGLNKKPVTIEMLHFGFSAPELPPDRTYGNITIHPVWYDLDKHEIATTADQE